MMLGFYKFAVQFKTPFFVYERQRDGQSGCHTTKIF